MKKCGLEIDERNADATTGRRLFGYHADLVVSIFFLGWERRKAIHAQVIRGQVFQLIFLDRNGVRLGCAVLALTFTFL